MVEGNARLTSAGRMIVRRVPVGRPTAHASKELGVSRQCIRRRVTRLRPDSAETEVVSRPYAG
nr:leucine zipper domain-containing protein [Sinosporangium siamense]